MPQTATNVRAASAVSLVSSSGKRMHPRVDLPVAVVFDDGSRRAAKDWSVAGFSLHDGAPAQAPGSIHRVRLAFDLADCEVLVEADAKVSWLADGQARGFRFIGLTADKAHLLDHFLQSRLEGDAAIVGGLPVAHGGANARPDRAALTWTRPLLHMGKLTLLTGLVLGGAAYGIGRFLTVTTDYAAVSAKLQQLHAPVAGFLQSDALAVGTHVSRGERIGALQPVNTPQARLAAETEIATLQTSLEQQTAAQAQAQAGFATFLQAARTDLEEATAARAMVEAQVTTEQKVFDRVTSLKASGIVAEQRVDEERQVLLTLQRTLSTARDTESTTRQKLANAEGGRFTSDGRSTEKSPADLQQQVATTEAHIARLKAILAALDQPLPLLSPCDCKVAALTATPGAYVNAGTQIADLAWDDAGAVSVDALVQNGRLAMVREGQAVTVYLAADTAPRTGRVTAVSFNPANTGRIGLPTALRTLDDYGLMTVALEGPGGGLSPGLPASIVAPISWEALMVGMPGAGWAAGAAREVGAAAGTLWTSTGTAIAPALRAARSVIQHRPA